MQPGNGTHKKIAWEVFTVAVTIYAALEIPLGLVFPGVRSPFLITTELLLTLAFAADLIYRYREADAAGPEVRRQYLRSWFWIDGLASIPFGTLIATPFRALRLLRLLRLVKLLRVNSAVRHLKGVQIINPSVVRMAVLMFWILLTAHFVAVGWIALGAVDPALAGGARYLEAMYWTSTTLTTIGYGDITPVTGPQTIFTIFIQILGAGLYGFVIGNIASLIANIDVAKTQFREKLERINTFLRYRAIPAELQSRVNDYYEYLWNSRRGHEEANILEELPLSLKTQIAYHINSEIIEKVPIFQGAGEQLIRDMILKLQPTVFLPNDYIVRKGETGREMYFISRGSVRVMSGDEKTTYATLTDGQFFGEIALLLATERTATIRANDYCDVYRLDQDTFNSIIERYPSFARHIREHAEQRREEMGL
ncbi:MAG: ion transporter [Spirochaetaceae bacterium]